MKPAIKRYLGVMLVLLSWLHAAESISSVSTEGIRVARFKGDRAGAVSITLDDGLRNQDDVAVALLNQYGIRATFFIIPGLTPETTEEAAKKNLAIGVASVGRACRNSPRRDTKSPATPGRTSR